MVEPAFQSLVAPELKIVFWQGFHDLEGKRLRAVMHLGKWSAPGFSRCRRWRSRNSG